MIENEKIKYKTIRIQIKVEDNDKYANIINYLNTKYSKNNIFIKSNHDQIEFNFKLINLEELEKDIAELNIKYKLNFEDNPFEKFLLEIKAIKSYGIKSGKRLYVDYNKERKVINRKYKEEKRHQYFYAENPPFSKKNNEVPPQFLNKIITGDSEEILKKIPDNSIDLIFTSPPYNFGLDYENNEDDVNWNEYFDKLFRIFKECIRIIKWGGRVIIDVQPLYSDYIPIHHIITNFFIENKMIWRNEIIWEKNNYSCKYTSWGSWKSPASPYLKYSWEFLEVFSKGSIKKGNENKNADITDDEFKNWVYGKWSIAPEKHMREFGHPAMFPEELVKRVIKLFSFKNDIILDPFNGGGTTTKVANLLSRSYIGIDISSKYCQIAERRINGVQTLEKFS